MGGWGQADGGIFLKKLRIKDQAFEKFNEEVIIAANLKADL